MKRPFATVKEDTDYEINREGVVRRKKTGRIIKPHVNASGYLCVNLKKMQYLHRLLCNRFKRNPKGKSYVLRRNGDKSDNSLANLKWGDAKESKLISNKNNPESKASREVYQLSLNGTVMRKHASTVEAAKKIGCSPSHIRHACKRGTTAGGFKWKYVKETRSKPVDDGTLIWKPIIIEKHETGYKVSNDGQVKNGKTGVLLKQFLDNGYKRVTLYVHRKPTSAIVHKLVANAFCGARRSRDVVDHKNEDKCDNNAANLRYMTPAENSAAFSGKKVSKTNLKTKKIVRVFNSISAAHKGLPVSRSHFKKHIKDGDVFELNGFGYQLLNDEDTESDESDSDSNSE